MDEFRGNEMSDSSVAEREFFEAARGYKDVLDGSDGFRFRDWEHVDRFLQAEDSYRETIDSLIVALKNGTTASLFKERLQHSWLHALREDPRYTDSPGPWGEADHGSMLLETPSHCMPYVYLSIIRVRNSRSMRIVLLYSAEDQYFDFLHQFWSRDFERNWRRHAKGAPYIVLVYNLLLSYMKSIIEEAKGLDAKIHHVEAALESRVVPSLSELLHELNVTSHKIRASNFEEQALFSKKAVTWVFEALKRSRIPEYCDKLQEVSDSMGVWQLAKLKERISDLRVHIDDVKDEQRQKREEDRQEREDARQAREDARIVREEARAELEQKRLDESIRIAKETKTDSRTMRGVAWVTMAFLPATFVSSFFGMNFFDGIAGKVPFDGASRNVWLFFAIAVPISGVVLFMFYFWDEHERKKDEKKVDGEKTCTISS